MFSKLGQRSTSWWICVMITGIFTASLITVTAYPAFAALCQSASCTKEYCGQGNFKCISCDTGLGGGDFSFMAAANTLTIELNSANNNCIGIANTYHYFQAENLSNHPTPIDLRYSSIITLAEAIEGCMNENPDHGTRHYDLVIPIGEVRTHSRKQSVTYQLGEEINDCTYQLQAMTEVEWSNGESGDMQCESSTIFEDCSEQ